MPKEKRHIYINSDYVDRFIGRREPPLVPAFLPRLSNNS